MSDSDFSCCVGEYDSYRPHYPDALFDYLEQRFVLQPSSMVIDAGAGTGRVTDPLAQRGYHVIATDISTEMLARVGPIEAAHMGQVDRILACAESLAVLDGLADLWVSGHAFHWFEPNTTLQEAARILKPGGGLAFFWNNRDSAKTPMEGEVKELVIRANPNYKGHRDKNWLDILKRSKDFTDIERAHFPHTVEMTADTYAGLWQSSSHIRGALDAVGLASFDRELRRLISRYHKDEKFPIYYIVDTYSGRRV